MCYTSDTRLARVFLKNRWFWHGGANTRWFIRSMAFVVLLSLLLFLGINLVLRCYFFTEENFKKS